MPNPPRSLRRALAATLACVLCALSGWPARAADPVANDPAGGDWSVGVAVVKITPQRPTKLAGYAARVQPFDHVDQDLYAKALALRDGEGNRAVLVTMDLCVMPRDVGQRVRERIAAEAHLDPAAVVLAVAHTHSAPPLAPLEPDGGAPATRPAGIADDKVQTPEQYTRWAEDRLAEAAADALAHLRPARLSWGSGVVSFAMNRRELTDRGIVLGVNPHGLVDRAVPVLRVDAVDRPGGKEGKQIAVLFGYACHNTTLPSNYLGVSGDYQGYAKAYVQAHAPGAEALFLAGCAGDANPYPRQQVPLAAAHGEELGKEVCRVLETKLKPVRGPLKCAAVTAELPLETPDRAALEAMVKEVVGKSDKAAPYGSLRRDSAKQMLATLDAGKKLPASYSAPVAAWQFGHDLTLLSLPDEVVSGYVPRLEEMLGPQPLWVAAYCHEVAGYVPTDEIVRQGGYEARGLYFDAGWFAAGVEQKLLDAAWAAAEAAGRPAPK